MEDRLELSLLGGLQVTQAGQPVTDFISGKAQALLCYLAVTGQTHLRPSLANLFWGNLSEGDARTNLRMVVSNLRKLLAPYLTITRQAVAFNGNSNYRLDVELFHQQVKTAGEGVAIKLTADQLAALHEAADLYRGDFLAGFQVRDALAFEEWVLTQQERLRESALLILHKLAAYYTAQRDYPKAIDYTTRLLALDPWREEAHRQRMLLLARCGRRSAALVQYKTCRRILTEELGVEPMTETTALYQRIRAMGATQVRGLPTITTSFVGRKNELTKITGLLAQPTCRLVTIIGPGGIGKTRLAGQVASEMADDFLNGVSFVPLAAVTSAEFLVLALADALNLSLAKAIAPKIQLLQYLQSLDLLLVLDNFEQLITPSPAQTESWQDGVEIVADILHNVPDVKILVTSHKQLDLQAEWRFELLGLMYPLQSSEVAVTTNLKKYSAVQLFVNSASRVRSDFALATVDLRAVVDICHLVQGMPLGLELAGSWVRQLSCQEIANEIAQNLDFLATSLRDVPLRHRSLRAVCNYTWQLLSESEQRVFMRLSVFRGGFGRDAAKQVADASLSLLSALVDKSLLRWNPSLKQYELHEFLRHYATEKLQEQTGKAVETQHRHGYYYTQFLRRRQSGLKRGRQLETLAEINAEIENVRTAWQWIIAHSQLQAIEQSLDSLYFFYEIVGRFQEGQKMFQQAITGLVEEQLSPNQSISEIEIENLVAGPADDAAIARPRLMILANLLAGRGGLLDRLGRYGEAQELLTSSLAMFDRLEARQERAFPLYHLGYIKFILGEYEAAQCLTEESLALFREQDQVWGVLPTLNSLGDILVAMGDYDGARQSFEESLSLSKSLGTRAEMGWAYQGLGDVYHNLGEYITAKQNFEQGLAIFEEIEALEGVAWAYHGLGDIALAQEDYAEAQDRYQHSLLLFTEIGDRGPMAETLNALGNVHYGLGNYHLAQVNLQKALREALEIQAIPVALYILARLAMVLLHTGSKKDKERIFAILVFTLHHPASYEETKEQATQILAELEPQLPAHIVVEAKKFGPTQTLPEVVAEVLKTI